MLGEWLKFNTCNFTLDSRKEFRKRLTKIRIKEIECLEGLDFEEFGALHEGISLQNLDQIKEKVVREYVMEFLSSFTFRDHIEALDEADTMVFQLGGEKRRSGPSTTTPPNMLSTSPPVLTMTPTPTIIYLDPKSHPLFGALFAYIVCCSVDVPWHIAKFLSDKAKGSKRKSPIMGAHLIGKIASYYGLMTLEALINVTLGPETSSMSVAKLVDLGICSYNGMGIGEMVVEILKVAGDDDVGAGHAEIGGVGCHLNMSIANRLRAMGERLGEIVNDVDELTYVVSGMSEQTPYSYVPNIPDLGVQQGVNFMSGIPVYSTASSPSSSQFGKMQIFSIYGSKGMNYVIIHKTLRRKPFQGYAVTNPKLERDIQRTVMAQSIQWLRYFKHTLKPKKEELTLVELGSHLRIEESLRAQDSDKPKGNNVAGPQLSHFYFKRMQDMSKDWLISASNMDTKKFVRLLDPKLKSLGKRGIECIFIGYAEHFKDFRLFVIEPNESFSITSIIESRDVIFDENRVSLVPRPSLSIPKGTDDIGGLVVPKEVTKEVVIQQPEPELKRSKRNRTPKNFRPEFQLYLIEGTRDEVSDQHSYCFNVEDDPKTFDEAMNTIRLLIAITSIYNPIIHHMDVKTAFLNGELEEEVYMNQPQGFNVPSNKNKVDLTKEVLSSRLSMKDMRKADVILSIRIKHESNGIAISQSEVGKLSRLIYTGYPLVLKGYTDASWISNTEDNSSTSGSVLLLGGGTISWASKKQTCITGSTMEYEFVALATAGKEAEWLKNLLLEIPLLSKPIAPISI
ncbi:zinc finger, CCHC-type containing protein [Tanacetum coccineum]|uniref:Zinc finger, CCHC-type containing protein n=1 Tax=Tanacetum coccineum TaxID=301880 RepID=A0ABQ5IYF9_9ASTR